MSKILNVSTDGATWHELEMELSALSAVDGVHNWAVGGRVLYAGGTALNMVIDAKIDKTDLYIQYLPEGTLVGGSQGKVVVTRLELPKDGIDVDTIKMSMQGDSTLVQATEAIEQAYKVQNEQSRHEQGMSKILPSNIGLFLQDLKPLILIITVSLLVICLIFVFGARFEDCLLNNH